MELPQHLLPNKPKEDIKTDVVDEASSENAAVQYDDIAKIGRELGVVTLSANMMDSLKRVGADLQNAGVVTVANGLAYVSAGAMTHVMLKLAQDVLTATTVTQREKMARVLAYVSTAIDKQNRTLKMDHLGQNAGGHVPPPRRGVAPHQHVHFHAAPKSE